MPITEPDRAIILAAGPGSRLTSETGTPKPLVRVGGKTLAEHTVLALRDGAGITNFIVVTGHEADAITAHFDLIARGHDVTVDAVTATDWRFGNGASALAAREHVGDAPFFLTMTDHMFDPEIAETLTRHVPEPGEMCLAVDRDKDSIFDLDDVTRVRLEDGQIQEIGKNLDAWDAADTGIMLCTSGLFEGLELAAGGGSASGHLTEPLGRHRQCTVELTRHILESDQSGDLDDGVIVELLLKARHEPVIHLHI